MNDWLEVTVETTDAQMDDLAARLTMNGAEGLVLENEADFKLFLEQNRQYWDYVDDALLERMRGVARIKFYVTDDAAGREQMAQALRGIENPVSTASMKEEDWAYGWQKYYQPMAVGERVYIVPEWERGKPVPEGRTAVYLNPGLTFGTGSHASTQLCLGLLEKYLAPGGAVLDLGWTSTPRRWMWPMRMRSSTASAGIGIWSGRGTCWEIRLWQRNSGRRGHTLLCLQTSWPT